MANMVKSVEFIEHTHTGTSTQVELTKGQNYENCVPFMTLHGEDDDQYSHLVDVYFNGTTESGVINFDRSVAGSARYIKCFVVEFEPTEVRVQQGTFGPLTGGVTAAYTTASGFDQTKTAMTFYWKSTSSTLNWLNHLVRGRVLDDNTQVDFYRYGNTGTVTGHYFLFEDITENNDHFIVDHQSDSFTGTGINKKVPNGRGDWSKTFIMGSWASSYANDDADDNTIRIYPYFRNFSHADRQASNGTIYLSVQHITFNDENRVYIASNYYASMGSGVTTQSQTLKRIVDLNKSCIISSTPFGLSRGNYSAPSQFDSLWVSMKFTDDSTAYFQRNSDGGGQLSYYTFAAIYWDGKFIDTGSNSSPLDPTKTFVKSVENFRLTIENYYASYDLTKGQDIDNCALFCSTRGASTGTNEMREAMATVWIREPGIVHGHSTDSTGQTIVDVSVVEFYPDQIRIQHGEWTHWGTTTENVTISGVNTDRAFILAKWESNEAAYWSRTAVRVRFSSDTNIELYRYGSGNIITGDFCVVEDLGDNFRTEHYIQTNSSSTVSNFRAQNFYLYYRDFMITSYATSNSDDDADSGTSRIYYTGNGFRFVIEKNTSVDTMYTSFQTVRMLQNRRYTFFADPTFGTSDTVFTYDIPSIHVGHEDAMTIFNPMQLSVGKGTSTSATAVRASFHTARLINNNTQYELSREISGSLVLYPSYTVFIDWIGYIHPLVDSEGNIPKALEIKSLVRSVEHFTMDTNNRISYYYLTKGQLPENCVPFHSWRVGADGGEMDRLHRWAYIDSNSRVVTYSEGGGSGGDIQESLYVVEFDPSQVKVQQVYGYTAGTSVDIDIEEVDLTKAFLRFGYSTDHWSNQWRYSLTTGKFNSSTQLNFSRNVSTGTVYIIAYVVECLQDQWYVTHDSTGSQSGSTDYYNYANYRDEGFKSRFIQGSYSMDTTNDDCDSATFRLWPRPEYYAFQWNKANSVETMVSRNLEVVEFNKKYNIRLGGYFTDFAVGESSETKSIVSDTPLDLDRSIVFPTIVNDINRVEGTAASYVGQVCTKFELTDSSTITCERYNKGTNSYGYFQWIEWPEYKSHYFEGIVTELSEPVIREVACYRADTYELMDSTTSSSGTGYYRLETTYSGMHYIICKDDIPGTSYNDLILGKMMPYPITSGTVWGNA